MTALTKREQARIKRLEELCRYMEGGGMDTADIDWLIREYLKLKAGVES